MIDCYWGLQYTSKAKFADYMSELERMGCKIIIINAIEKMTHIGDCPRTVQNSELSWMVDIAKSHNMEIYLGLCAVDLSDPDGYLRKPYNHTNPDSGIAHADSSLIEELRNSTSVINKIAGYYVFQEMEIMPPFPIEQDLRNFYHKVTSKIKEADPDKKIVMCGYLNQLKNVYTWKEYKTPSEVTQWIQNMFTGTPSVGIDNFLFEDGVGGWEMPVNKIDSQYYSLTDYLGAIKAGLAASSPHVAFWIQPELWQTGPGPNSSYAWPTESNPNIKPTSYNTPSFIKLVSQQLNIEKNFAENATLVTWQNEFMTEYPAFDTANNLLNKGKVHLLRGYNAKYRGIGNWYDSFTYSYEGNILPNPSYPDNGTKLKDGDVVQQSRISWHDDKLVGFIINPNYNSSYNDSVIIKVDLGSVKPVSDVSAIFTAHRDYNILYPENLKVYISKDGSDGSWKKLGEMKDYYPLFKGYSDLFDSNSPYYYYLAAYFVSADTPSDGQFLRIVIVPQSKTSNLMVNELEIYSCSNTVIFKGNNNTVAEDPKEFKLGQNYPNPFNPTTNITYSLKENSKVILKVYNMLGQEIKTLVNGFQEAGNKSIIWNGKNDLGESVPSGCYIYRIEAGNFVSSQKMLLMK
jgi:hypothetical protein